MMKFKRRVTNQLIKKAQKGFRGYPVATVAYYGPDNQKATKVAVGIITREDGEPDPLRRWYAGEKDARLDLEITNQVLAFIKEHKAVSLPQLERYWAVPMKKWWITRKARIAHIVPIGLTGIDGLDW